MSNRAKSPKIEKNNRRFYALSFLGLAFASVCILFILSFIWFQPDQFSLSDRYFPSPTATATPTNTPTPNLTATQKVIQATATKAVKQWQVMLSDTFESNENDWDTGYIFNE